MSCGKRIFSKVFCRIFSRLAKSQNLRTQKSDYCNLCENFSKRTFQNDCAVTNEVESDFDTCGFKVRKILKRNKFRFNPETCIFQHKIFRSVRKVIKAGSIKGP